MESQPRNGGRRTWFSQTCIPEHPSAVEREVFCGPPAPPSVPSSCWGSFLRILLGVQSCTSSWGSFLPTQDLSGHPARRHVPKTAAAASRSPCPCIRKDTPPFPNRRLSSSIKQHRLSGVKVAPPKPGSRFPQPSQSVLQPGYGFIGPAETLALLQSLGRCWFVAHRGCVSIAEGP